MPAPTPKTSLAAPAIVVVSLPADAKLTIDGVETTTSSATRTFVSPTLPTGKEFSYSFTAEIVRGGEKVTRTEQVTVRGGMRTNVNLEFPVAVVASR